MSDEKHEGQSGGVNISGGRVHTGGDIVGRDKVTHGDSISAGDIGSGANVAMGRGAQALQNSGNVTINVKAWDSWRADMFKHIDTLPNLEPDQKEDAKKNVEEINAEAKKGDKANAGRLERLINTIAIVAPDAFEVAVATVMSPLAGIGLALKKIADRAVKIEKAQQGA